MNYCNKNIFLINNSELLHLTSRHNSLKAAKIPQSKTFSKGRDQKSFSIRRKGPTVHPPVLHYKQKLAFLGIYTLILWFMIIFELKGVFAINHMH